MVASSAYCVFRLATKNSISSLSCVRLKLFAVWTIILENTEAMVSTSRTLFKALVIAV